MVKLSEFEPDDDNLVIAPEDMNVEDVTTIVSEWLPIEIHVQGHIFRTFLPLFKYDPKWNNRVRTAIDKQDLDGLMVLIRTEQSNPDRRPDEYERMDNAET